MSLLPFPNFVKQLPVGDTDRAALTAVGKCRIDPSSYPQFLADYQAIVETTSLQAQHTTTESTTNKNDKVLCKQYMKQSIAQASHYLRDKLQLDVSMCKVQVVVSMSDIILTQACIATCFLNAGCDTIIVRVPKTATSDDPTTQSLLDIVATHVPANRIGWQLASSRILNVPTLVPRIQSLSNHATTVSISVPPNANAVQELLQQLAQEQVTVSLILELDPHETQPDNNTNTTTMEEEPDGTVQEDWLEVTKVVMTSGYQVALQDPTADQLAKAIFASCLKSDRPDGLVTTVVTTRHGVALGLVYSNQQSMTEALKCGRGVYYSRSRQGLWRKGDTSGHVQILHRFDVDCDGDALRCMVTQCVPEASNEAPAFCHLNTLTCWGRPVGLLHLQETLQERLHDAPEGSYTQRLFQDSQLLRDKLVEEAQELSEATSKEDVAGELADVLYFSMVRAVQAGVTIDDAVAVLDARAAKVTRRQGDSKAERIEAAKEILQKKE